MKRQIIIPSFAVSPPLITTAPVLPSVNQGLAYSQQLTAVGGYPPYNWTVVSDSGSGLTLNATSGVLSGNANVAGTFTIVIKVTDYRLFPSAPVSFSLTVNPTGSNLTIYHGLAIAVTLPGTGSKDHAGTLVFDQGFAPLTVVDPQWASAGGSLGFISGGAFTGADAQYNPGNVAYGMQTSGSTIAAPHIYSQACAKGTLAYNPPGSSAGEPTFTAQIGHSNKTFPKHTFISFKYRVDPLFVFGLGSPNNDNNWKFITYTDGATTCFTNAGGSNIAQYYYCGSGSGQGAFSGPAGVGWQCAFDEAFPAMNPTNLAIAPDNNGHSIEWPFGSADSGDPQYMTRYASQYNPVNPSNGFVITEYRIRWMTDTTGYVQARSSTIGLAFPPKLCINYQQQTAEPSGNGNTAVWNEGWICTYTRNYGTVGSPQYNNAMYVADHMYDQDGSNTYQAYLHDQPTLAASTWWEPQKYTGWTNGVLQVVCNVATVPLGTAYITAVNDVGTESAAQKVTVVAQPAAPVITTASLPSATVGSAYSFDATSTGGVTPITWSATGLPAGLSIAPSNGLITGTPTTAGTDSVTLAVQDGLNRWVYKTLTLTVNATGTLNFPLLGAYLIGGSVQSAWGTSAFQAQVAKLGCAIIGTYPGWSSGGFTMASAAAAVKTINPNIKLTMYVLFQSAFNSWSSQGSTAQGPLWTAINNGNSGVGWWARTTYPSGAIVAGSNFQYVNLCDANFMAYIPGYCHTNTYPTNYVGTYIDNFTLASGISADLAENGTTQSSAASESLWQTSYAAIVAAMRTAGIGQVWANVANFGITNTAKFTNILDGGVMESAIGQSYSYEHVSWAELMADYKAVMQMMRTPNYMVFEQDNASSTNYAAMRYGLTACLLDNGYYFYNTAGAGGGATIIPFDETNFNLGTQIAGPNSTATGTYSNGNLTVWQNGVWRRDFQNGIILHNPRGNGAQTVTLETTYWHLRQSIDTDGVNSAASTTSVTLPDAATAGNGGGGLFLSRTAT